MMELAQSYWLWLILAFILLLIELLSGTLYALWLAIAAVFTGIVAYFFPANIIMQIILFSLLSLAVIALVYRYFSNEEIKVQEKTSLNQRGHSYIGQTFSLEKSIVNGKGSIRIGDSMWLVRCSNDLNIDTKVTVVGCDDNHLIVEPVIYVNKDTN